MELREALTQISEIRERMARGQTFRGYRAATVATSGTLAFLAAGLQAVCLPRPLEHVTAYLWLWVGVATLSTLLVGTEMVLRARRSGSPLQGQVNWLAVEQLLPSLVAGALLTYVVMKFANQQAWMLPGLWAVIFSLGIYSSCRLLPRATFWVAGFYLIAGLLCLALAQGANAFSPYAMGGTFGVGQWFMAGVLYWNLERGYAGKANPSAH